MVESLLNKQSNFMIATHTNTHTHYTHTNTHTQTHTLTHTNKRNKIGMKITEFLKSLENNLSRRLGGTIPQGLNHPMKRNKKIIFCLYIFLLPIAFYCGIHQGGRG